MSLTNFITKTWILINIKTWILIQILISEKCESRSIILHLLNILSKMSIGKF